MFPIRASVPGRFPFFLSAAFSLSQMFKKVGKEDFFHAQACRRIQMYKRMKQSHRITMHFSQSLSASHHYNLSSRPHTVLSPIE
jgi:hypothetical protein